MAASKTDEITISEEFLRVHDWRLERLLELGFHSEDAEEVLKVVSSWHDVERLIRLGATVDQVKATIL